MCVHSLSFSFFHLLAQLQCRELAVCDILTCLLSPPSVLSRLPDCPLHLIFSRLPVWSLHSRSSGVVHSFLTPDVLGQSTENYYLYLVHHTFHDRALIIVTCATPTLTPDPALGANKRAASPALVTYVRYHSSVSTPSPHRHIKNKAHRSMKDVIISTFSHRLLVSVSWHSAER